MSLLRILIVTLSQRLARGNPGPADKDYTELQRLCGRHRTVPTQYNLGGITREGDVSKRISKVIEIWKGRYNDEVVALKVLKVSLQDPHILAFTSVSVPRDPGQRAT